VWVQVALVALWLASRKLGSKFLPMLSSTSLLHSHATSFGRFFSDLWLVFFFFFFFFLCFFFSLSSLNCWLFVFIVICQVKLNILNHSFETRTGPVGWPGTRPIRAWDRSESKNPPESWPSKPAWVNPAETRPFFFLYRDIKLHRFGILKSQNDEGE